MCQIVQKKVRDNGLVVTKVVVHAIIHPYVCGLVCVLMLYKITPFKGIPLSQPKKST